MDDDDVRLEILTEARRLLMEYNEYSSDTTGEKLKLLNALIDAAERKADPQETVEWSRLLAADLLQNQALLTTIKEQSDELDALKKLSLNLTSSLNLQTVLDAVVTEAMHLVENARSAYIYLYTNGILEFGASLNREEIHNVPTNPPRDHGLTYTAAKSGERLIIEDMRTHPLYAETPKEWTGSIIAIPLRIGERVLGVMNLSRSTVGSFPSSELHLLKLLAEHASVAISNASLHEMLDHAANNDTVTGLPNRRALDHHLEQIMIRARRNGSPFGVVMLDVDGFKSVNDSYGHATGDQVLRTFFNYLATGLRSTDFLARYGGDELTLVLSESDPAAARIVVEKILEKVQTFHFDVPGSEPIRIGLSCGIAFYPIDALNPDGLLRSADEALYEVKKHHRGSSLFAPGTRAILDPQS